MHESDRVMPQFGFVKNILSSPQNLNELYKIDLWGRTEEDWSKFHAKYINLWAQRMQIQFNTEEQDKDENNVRDRDGDDDNDDNDKDEDDKDDEIMS
ncbi:hypothetical protein J1N35_017984 [Gossypium stocksii]|uniref:Uncharacterized protein n=1 Tax=Gossypium stocksii TaxID=47602 RepID=A0A9D4A4K6_9ROSI|nr:hypothetical protein J1N35_017984 [Gossypium stocksii]